MHAAFVVNWIILIVYMLLAHYIHEVNTSIRSMLIPLQLKQMASDLNDSNSLPKPFNWRCN